MTPKQKLKRIKQATEKAEDALNLLQPLIWEDAFLDEDAQTLLTVILHLKTRWGQLSAV